MSREDEQRAMFEAMLGGKREPEDPNKLKLQGAVVEALDPQVSVDDVILPLEVKNRVMRNITTKDSFNKRMKKYRLGHMMEKGKGTTLLFLGASGTGKTMYGEAIAKELNMKYAIINSGNIDSEYYGASSKNVNNALKWAEKQNVVLIFDEA